MITILAMEVALVRRLLLERMAKATLNLMAMVQGGLDNKACNTGKHGVCGGVCVGDSCYIPMQVPPASIIWITATTTIKLLPEPWNASLNLTYPN